MITSVPTTTTEVTIPIYHLASYIIGIIVILLIILWIVMKYSQKNKKS
jgi:hypothetical protein